MQVGAIYTQSDNKWFYKIKHWYFILMFLLAAIFQVSMTSRTVSTSLLCDKRAIHFYCSNKTQSWQNPFDFAQQLRQHHPHGWQSTAD